MQRTLADTDPEIARAIRNETTRQAEGLELIASENFVSSAILEAAGSVLTNKYAEGYPGQALLRRLRVRGRRRIAGDRARQGSCSAPTTPTCSRTRARRRTCRSTSTLLQPGDTVLGMNLAHGGHLTHGHPLNFSGKLYTIVPYGVRKDDERIDYEELERLAHEHKPKMIMVGASAYPRVIDFPRIAQVAARRRRADGRRHGAHRRPRRRRRAPEPGAARRLRHLDDAQDAARARGRG